MRRVSVNARARAALTLALVATAALTAACGGSGDARSLLSQAFSHSIHSGSVSLNFQLAASGASGLGQPTSLSLSGPYQSNGGRKLPSFAWSYSLVASGRALSGSLTSTGDDVFLGYGGRNYDLGAQRFAQLNQQLAASANGSNPRSLKSYGVDPNAWVTNASNEGDATVGGAATTHVRAGLDVSRALHDLNRTLATAGGALGGAGGQPRQLSDAQINQFAQSLKNPTFDVYVGKADKKLRRIAFSLAFQVPPSARQQFRGATGGTVSFSLELANVGQPQQITAPPNAIPLNQLLGIPGLQAPGSGLPGAGR